MALEIERKFLVEGDSWRASASLGVPYRQGYMRIPNGVLRIRIAGAEAFLTVKGELKGISRLEFEYPIPVPDADEMLSTLCERPLIEKTRHRMDWKGSAWEIDVFHGDNEGLVMAEIELSSENESFELPPWTGKELSGDFRYCNSNLARNPYKNWGSEAKGGEAGQ